MAGCLARRRTLKVCPRPGSKEYQALYSLDYGWEHAMLHDMHCASLDKNEQHLGLERHLSNSHVSDCLGDNHGHGAQL